MPLGSIRLNAGFPFSCDACLREVVLHPFKTFSNVSWISLTFLTRRWPSLLNGLTLADPLIYKAYHFCHDALETFHKNLPSDAPAREYAGGLGDLALGILLKERSGIPRSPMGFDAFEVKMKSSLDVLKPFDRPVALAACGCVRFNLNDFQDYGVAATVEVDKGLRFFRDIAMGCQVAVAEGGDRQNVQDGNQCAICPVDHLTHRLLSACSQLANGNSISPEDLESLRQIKRGMLPVSQQDRVKIDVICAEGYLRIDRGTDALQHLQDIQFDPTFKDWSQYQMSEKV